MSETYFEVEHNVTTTREFKTVIGEQDCQVIAAVSEWFKPRTGDSIEAVTIGQIISIPSGQMIEPRSLSLDEFKRLVNQVKQTKPKEV